MDEKFSVSGEYVFRGIEYRVSFHTVQKTGRCLSVEVEDRITGDQWKGYFDPSCKFMFSCLDRRGVIVVSYCSNLSIVH